MSLRSRSAGFAVGSGRAERRWVGGPGSKLDSRYVRGPFVAVDRHAVACLRSSGQKIRYSMGLILEAKSSLHTLGLSGSVTAPMLCQSNQTPLTCNALQRPRSFGDDTTNRVKH
jgi:hypothetical protein